MLTIPFSIVKEKKTMKKSPMILLVMLFFLISGCTKESSESEEETKIPVHVSTVERGDVVQSLNYSGDIKAEYEIKVFSKIPDRIEKFHVDEGDRVSKGQTIAHIYAATIEQGVRQAEAGLVAAKAQAANAQVEYARAKKLYKENAMSKQQFDAIETQYEAATAALEQAEAALNSAKSSLNDATVTAPISGIIGKRYYEEGDMAGPSIPLVTVVQMNNVKITFDATETDLGKLSVGQKSKIRVKSYSDKEFTGAVTKISPVLDPVTRMAEVEVLIDNSDQKLKPGMYANVTVITGTLEDVIVVPRYATVENTYMRREQGKDKVLKNYYVFVAKNDIAEQRLLDVQYVNHMNIAVNSGVEPGEKLIIQGQNNLRDKVAISVIEEDRES
jgi:RND family efflux transporter MFP subunit